MTETKHRQLCFSGMQPTNALHLGNYLGALKNWVKLQEQMTCLYCVVDLHALTQDSAYGQPKELSRSIREVAAAYIACGVDPKKVILFNQSRVAQHAELAWVFNCVARVGWLDRMTQFKEKTGKHKERASVGLYTYPVLMAADILLYKGTHVPVQGDTDFSLPKFNAGDQQINLRVQLADSARQDLQSISGLRLPGRQGMIPLSAVADVHLGTGPVQLLRYDRARQITFSANLAGGASLGDASSKIDQLPVMRNLPPGVFRDQLGNTKIMAEIFGGFATAMGTGILFIYVVLVLLFGSFLLPATIMVALPLSICGSLGGLLLMHKELGMMGLIGILMLMGLVTKNSILLVEYAMRSRQNGLSRREALMQAGNDRLRPILMTTIAMIAGMLPIALEFGEGTERLSPMAAAVIGGLVTSTLLTLVVVPAAYTFVDDFMELLKRLTGAFAGRKAASGTGSAPAPLVNSESRSA